MNPGFGERLRDLRRAAGVSQVELAGDQLSPSYISLLEAGKRQPSSEVIQLIAQRLNCTVGDLVDPVTREQAQRAELELAYAKLAMANGEYQDVRRRLEPLLPAIASDRRLTDEGRYLLSEAYWRGGDYRRAVETVRPLYERCLARASHLPLTTVGLRLTRFFLDAGDLQAAIRYGEAALQAMSEQGLEDTDEYLRAAATLVAAYHVTGDLTHASASSAALIERAQRRGSTPGQAALYWNAALVEETQGNLAGALQLSQRALALLSEQSPSRDLGVLYATCASILLEAAPDRAGEAVGLLERALPLLKDFATGADLGDWEATRARAALVQGEPVTAEEFARRAVVSLAGEARIELAQAQMSLGDALDLQERHQAANDAYRSAGEALHHCPPSRATAAIWRELAERLVRLGQTEAAVTAYGQALDAAAVRGCVLPTERPPSRGLAGARSATARAHAAAVPESLPALPATTPSTTTGSHR